MSYDINYVEYVEPSGVQSQKDIEQTRRVTLLISRIDENPDLLHFDSTPAVTELIDIGRPAIEPLLDLMLNQSSVTSMRAERALYGILRTMHGFRYGQGWPNPLGVALPEAEQRFLDLKEELGELRWDAPLESRQKSVIRWREWLAKGARITPARIGASSEFDKNLKNPATQESDSLKERSGPGGPG